MNRRRIFAAFQKARRPPVDSADRAGEWMPLAEAAQALWAAQRGSDLDRMARGLSDNADALLLFWAQRVAQIGIPVYGCRIMSEMLEIIPDAVLAGGRIYQDATRLDVGRGEPSQDFCLLQVKRRDFEARMQALSPDTPT